MSDRVMYHERFLDSMETNFGEEGLHNCGVPEREGSNETDEYCLKRLHYLSYFIATALTWR